MPVISNRNTTQTPITAGRSGTQVVKFIDAPRVYIKAADGTPTPVTTKSNGSTPTGYTDLGIVNGKVKVTYEKEIKEIRTGLDNVLRASYITQRTANFEFVLSQFDDTAMEQLSGLTPSVIAGQPSAWHFSVGTEDIVQKALLMVLQNKLDGKEWQFYHPSADLTFNIEDSGEETVLRGTGTLKAFTWNAAEALMIQTIFPA